MTPDSFYFRTITGQARGPIAACLRGLLTVLSWPYALVIRLRNAAYDVGLARVHRASLPVVCIGNLTTGGTGKTPMVLWVLRRLLEAGCRPGVLMRGYRASPATCCSATQTLQDAIHGFENDEAREIRRRCPTVDLFIDPDRVAGAARAEGSACRVLVMDDGFQHRRLARDLDVVLVDATNPLGSGMLPRGLAREPWSSLARAGAVVITRADRVSTEALHELRRRVETYVPAERVFAAGHPPVELTDQAGESLAADQADPGWLRGRRVWLFAAVGNPSGVLAAVKDLGAEVVGHRFWPDHHTWTDEQLDAMAAEAGDSGAEAVVTTEKDAVKLPPDRLAWPGPLRVLRVGIAFTDGREDDFAALILRLTRKGSDA